MAYWLSVHLFRWEHVLVDAQLESDQHPRKSSVACLHFILRKLRLQLKSQLISVNQVITPETIDHGLKIVAVISANWELAFNHVTREVWNKFIERQ